jgi:hypothetical protein
LPLPIALPYSPSLPPTVAPTHRPTVLTFFALEPTPRPARTRLPRSPRGVPRSATPLRARERPPGAGADGARGVTAQVGVTAMRGAAGWRRQLELAATRAYSRDPSPSGRTSPAMPSMSAWMDPFGCCSSPYPPPLPPTPPALHPADAGGGRRRRSGAGAGRGGPWGGRPGAAARAPQGPAARGTSTPTPRQSTSSTARRSTARRRRRRSRGGRSTGEPRRRRRVVVHSCVRALVRRARATCCRCRRAPAHSPTNVQAASCKCAQPLLQVCITPLASVHNPSCKCAQPLL